MCPYDAKRVADGLQPRLNPHLVARQRFSPWLLLTVVCMSRQGIGDAAPFDSLIACSQLIADAERLACFDREVTAIRNNGPSSPRSVAPTAEQAFGLTSKEMLGLEARPGEAPPPTELHAHLVRVSRSTADRQAFILDNAQTWQQIELDPDFAVRIGQEVTISKGALGSFWLAIDSHRATRVKRIQLAK